MSGVDNKKYLSSILFVFAVGALLNLAVEQHVWRGVRSWATLLQAIERLNVTAHGPSDIWKFVGSGGTLAAVYVWLFEKFLWKIPFLQGWLVRFPNLSGTWVGVLTPRTQAMLPGKQTPSATAQTLERQAQPVNTGPKAKELERQPQPPMNSSIPDWALRKGVLPIHLTIDHEFDKLTYTALHPNSTNKVLAYQLVYVDQGKQTLLYVVYFNEPKEDREEHAAAHKGCCKLELSNNERTKSATSEWRLTGVYWTDKVRDKHKNEDDRGTWGNFNVRWESRKVGEKKVDWSKQEKFDA